MHSSLSFYQDTSRSFPWIGQYVTCVKSVSNVQNFMIETDYFLFLHGPF